MTKNVERKVRSEGRKYVAVGVLICRVVADTALAGAPLNSNK